MKLTTEAQFERFAEFPAEVFRGDPCYRPSDPHDTIAEISNRSPYAAHSRAQPFWISEGDRILAVVAALIDGTYDERWNEHAGHLVRFDALPDAQEPTVALLDEACAWLRDNGATFARQGLKFGWQLPLTIDAYDEPPTFLHTYNRPYYHRYLKNAGFATEKGVVELRVQFTPALENLYRTLAVPAGFTLRPWDVTRLDAETRLFHRLLDETFAEHWGAGPFTLDELSGFTAGLRDILPPSYCWFADVAGEPAGFVYALPDLNQGASITHGILLIIGVRKQFRGKGVNLALGARSYLAMIENGCTSASYTVVLDDNWPSRRTAEKLGCRVARNFAIYRRELQPPCR